MPCSKLVSFSAVRPEELWENEEDLDAQRSCLDMSANASFHKDFLLDLNDDDFKASATEGVKLMPWEIAAAASVGKLADQVPADEKKTGRVSAGSLASTECPASFQSMVSSFASGRECDSKSPGGGFRPPPGLEEVVAAAPAKGKEAAGVSGFLVPPPPPPPPAPVEATCTKDCKLPSKGSQYHHVDKCTPCKFFRGNRGCRDEEDCSLCHYPHEELTYSAIRRGLKKRAIEKQQWITSVLEQQQAASEPAVASTPVPVDASVPGRPVTIRLQALSTKFVMSF